MSAQNEETIYKKRQNQLRLGLQTAGLDAVVVNAGPSLTYLTGLHFHLIERPVVAVFRPNSPVLFVLPELEAGKTTQTPFELQANTYGEEPSTWSAAFRSALKASGLSRNAHVGVEPERLRYLELSLLKEAGEGLDFQSAADLLASLRSRKDDQEIAAMRRAVVIAQDALRAALKQVRIGMTETEFAAELTLQLLRGGSQPEIPFAPIVASGPNAANPHATPSNRQLKAGDLLIVDWGARFDGYISDITRTFAVGNVSEEAAHIHKIVQAANQAGRDTAAPDAAAEDIDNSARRVIEEAGYGSYFIHRTGHGIGMDVHEAPYIRAGNQQSLQPGMTFTVEPGIYIPGKFGVRIEDNVLITSQGAESLTDFPRDLEVIA
jgi:Xaa-Pro dipeptidase